MKALFAAGLATTMTAALLGATSHSASAGTGVVHAPADGASVGLGWSGPIKLDFPETSNQQRYLVHLESSSGSYMEDEYFYSYGNDENQDYDAEMSVPALDPDDYTITVSDQSENEIDSTLLYVMDQMAITNVALSPVTFYPLVRDGYRDATVIKYSLGNRAEQVIARVYNSKGRVVRREDLGSQGGGRESWKWNGRKDDGSIVNEGKYRVSIRALSGFGAEKTVSQMTTATTKLVTKHASKRRSGTATSSTARRGNCYINRYSYSQEIDLDCWGGVYAKANYRFTLPRTAYGVTWFARGYRGCCSEGRITKTGAWTSGTSVAIRVSVTNWRSFTVQRVGIDYAYKVRR